MGGTAGIDRGRGESGNFCFWTSPQKIPRSSITNSLQQLKRETYCSCRVKVEQLDRREEADYIYQEINFHEEVYMFGFWKRQIILHSIEEYDLKNNVITRRVDNQQPATDLFGTRSKFKTFFIIARNLYQLNANEVPLTLYDTC